MGEQEGLGRPQIRIPAVVFVSSSVSFVSSSFLLLCFFASSLAAGGFLVDHQMGHVSV